jgi:branched-subunit amino acid aminotransferase/4-amino-4-deoxychorismate lyase
MPPEPIAYSNGRFVPPGELTLSFDDAGFVAGATVTDFCRTYRHRLFRWPDHLARLRRDCAACRIPLSASDAELTAAADRLVAHNAPLLGASGELALVMFATPGPLGYLTGRDENGPPTVGMHTVLLPVARYRRFFTDGVTLEVVGALPTGLPMAVKHRSRLYWWLADRATSEPGSVPALLAADGSPDTAIGGVLAVRDGAVVRPPAGSVLESVSVEVVRELCGRLGLLFAEGAVDLADATEVLLAGSGFGLAGVRRVVGGQEFAWPGPVLLKLQAAWSDLVGLDVVRQMTGTF